MDNEDINHDESLDRDVERLQDLTIAHIAYKQRNALINLQKQKGAIGSSNSTRLANPHLDAHYESIRRVHKNIQKSQEREIKSTHSIIMRCVFFVPIYVVLILWPVGLMLLEPFKRSMQFYGPGDPTLDIRNQILLVILIMLSITVGATTYIKNSVVLTVYNTAAMLAIWFLSSKTGFANPILAVGAFIFLFAIIEQWARLIYNYKGEK
jgi:hypothetical protein